jgi:hypothetical protein
VHGDQDPLDGFPLLDEGDEAQGMVFAAGFTVEVCEASPQDSTRNEPVQLLRHELGQRASAGLVGPEEGKGPLLPARASCSIVPSVDGYGG